jgi:hypothetical protein
LFDAAIWIADAHRDDGRRFVVRGAAAHRAGAAIAALLRDVLFQPFTGW